MNIHIYPSIFSNETRIIKIVQSLRRASIFPSIVIIGVWKEGLARREVLEEGIEVVRIPPIMGAKLAGGFGRVMRIVGWYLGVLLAVKNRQIDCLNCHSVSVMPLSVLIKLWKRCRLIYDPHELETETVGLRGIRQRVTRIVEGCLIRFADAVCVVNRSIAEWYESEYRIRGVHVVRNVPYRAPISLKRTGLLRREAGLSSDQMVFLYQGLLAPGRGVSILIDVFSSLPGDFHLILMGYGELSEKVRCAASVHKNIHYIPAVPPDQLHRYTVDADVGISLIEDICLSYRLSLPNKLFEYAVCGVPVIVSDFPEMGRIVDKFNLGWKIPPNRKALREIIWKLTLADVQGASDNARRAGEVLCWQKEEDALFAIYKDLGFRVQEAAAGDENRSESL